MRAKSIAGLVPEWSEREQGRVNEMSWSELGGVTAGRLREDVNGLSVAARSQQITADVRTEEFCEWFDRTRR